MPYGNAWRDQRKIYQTLLSVSAVGSFRPMQEAEATLTLHHLMETPGKYYDHLRRTATAVILSSVFGIQALSFDDPKIQRLYHVQEQFTAIAETGASPPVDIFPIFKWLPNFMAPWRERALQIRHEQRELYFELLRDVQESRSKGIRRNCFMDQLLEESARSKHKLDDEHLAYIGGVLMEGGSDTTAANLLSFLLAMVKYPHVLRKAQAAVDEVCGTQRSPTFDDLARLPYLKCCVDEILRWRPAAPSGIPHMLIQGPVPHATLRIKAPLSSAYTVSKYQQMIHMRATIFQKAQLAIHHDPELYEDPNEFIPERYELQEFGFKPGFEVSEGLRKTYGFGAGRRVCPGSHLATNSLAINTAKIIWAFDIRPGKDPITGLDLTPDDISVDIEKQWTNGILVAPKPFPVSLTVRSDIHRTIIQEELRRSHEAFQG
ncbi:hypothetical protein ABOM_006660 [Aspergillus bombycis]|uniref:Cytochrome P450 n=1 Tax=Aspergillus bombycis TaxID=109264 RepID=A0A1F8A1F6_9EURO|nr:hypothetical protein ABOM_006660 [Aspergillus bombycis]OGM45138.1 hypothetical protein ABOM_006660 [Aspergillus bombycis]